MTTRPILLTGVTGGLGATTLHHLLHTHSLPPASIIATSRSASNRSRFESQGLQFRVADFALPETLDEAFKGVGTLLFVSSSERDNAKRMREHGNVVDAAKKAEVGRVWYLSLAFGGFGDGSQIGFQRAHYETEDLLRESGLDFLSLRAGIYADAFPLFLNWYPSSKAVLLPKLAPPVSESKLAFTSRDELGEAIATLLAKGFEAFSSIKPQTKKNIILLTGPKGESLVDLVGAINRGRGTDIPVNIMEPQAWIEECAKDDEGGKGRAWFEARLIFTQGVCNGDAEVVDPTLETLLGRRPEMGTESVERFVRANPSYTWHQNHAR